MQELTYDEAIGFLHRAIDDKGFDYEYTPTLDVDGDSQCVYFHKGQPSCIVGHVMHYMDITPATVGFHEGSSASATLRGMGVELEYGVTELLDVTQWRQDDGIPWGIAVRAGMSAAKQIMAEA